MSLYVPYWIRCLDDVCVAEDTRQGFVRSPAERRISLDEWFERYVATGLAQRQWKEQVALRRLAWRKEDIPDDDAL